MIAERAWPFAAALLACLLVLQAVPGRAAKVLVVGLGLLAAMRFGHIPPLDGSTLAALAAPLAAVLGLVLIDRSVPRQVGRSLTILWSRTVLLPAGPPPTRTVVTCAAGSLRVDARRVDIGGGETLAVRLVLSDVVLRIPADWQVLVSSATLAGVSVRDRGAVPVDGPEVLLEVTGLLGSLVVDRR